MAHPDQQRPQPLLEEKVREKLPTLHTQEKLGLLAQATFRSFTPPATAYCGTLAAELPAMQGDLAMLNTRLELIERPLRRFIDNCVAVQVACEGPELVEDMVQGARIAIWRKWQRDPTVVYHTDSKLKSIGKWGAINEAHRMRGSSTYLQGRRGEQRTFLRREVMDSTGIDHAPDTSLLEHAEHQAVRRLGWVRPVEQEALDHTFSDWLVSHILQAAPTEHQRRNLLTLMNHLKDGYTWLEAGRAEGWCSAKAQKLITFIRTQAEQATGWKVKRDKRGATGTINKARAALTAKRARKETPQGGGSVPMPATYPAQ